MYKVIVNSVFVLVLGLLSMFGLGALYDRPKNKEPTYILQKGYDVDSLIQVDTIYLDFVPRETIYPFYLQKPSSYG